MVTQGTQFILGRRVKSKVKVNNGMMFIKRFEHDANCSFGPITSKLHMKVVDDERMNPIDFRHRVKGQCQLLHSEYKTLRARYRLQFLSNHF